MRQISSRRSLFFGGVRRIVPTDLADLWAWWDIATLSTLFQDSVGITPIIMNGDPIGYIADRSDNGRYVAQTGAVGTRPTYTTGVQNGLPVATFDGGDYLDSVATIDSWPITVIGVARTSGTVDTSRGIVSAHHSTLFGSRVAFTTANNLRATMATPNVLATGAIAYGANRAFLCGWRGTGSTIELIDAGALISAAHSAAAVANIISMGRINVNTTTSLFSGSLCEVCVYNRVLTNVEIGQLSAYLNAKWGVF